MKFDSVSVILIIVITSWLSIHLWNDWLDYKIEKKTMEMRRSLLRIENEKWKIIKHILENQKYYER